MSTIRSSTTKSIHQGANIVWNIAAIFEILLTFRFFLEFLGANSNAGFTNFVYSITYSFASPFLTVFPSSVVDGHIFEWSTLLAMFIYWLIAVIIVKIFVLGGNISGTQTHTVIQIERKEDGKN